MEKPKIVVGVDFGNKDMNTEVICRHHPDGTIEVLNIHQWNKEITLNRDEYKVNPR